MELTLKNIFADYLIKRDIETLEKSLKSINGWENLWFRFFNGDTSSTTVQDVINSLILDTNDDLPTYTMINKLKGIVSGEHHLQIYHN